MPAARRKLAVSRWHRRSMHCAPNSCARSALGSGASIPSNRCCTMCTGKRSSCAASGEQSAISRATRTQRESSQCAAGSSAYAVGAGAPRPARTEQARPPTGHMGPAPRSSRSTDQNPGPVRPNPQRLYPGSGSWRARSNNMTPTTSAAAASTFHTRAPSSRGSRQSECRQSVRASTAAGRTNPIVRAR